jgi:hypothetical protein
MGASLVKNPKILVEEIVRSTAVGTFRISQFMIINSSSSKKTKNCRTGELLQG